MSNNSNTLLAVITGTAIGAALGVLFAPDKGSVTRQRIADETNARKDNLVDSANQLKYQIADNLSDKKATLDSRVESIMSDASYKAEDVISTLEKRLSQLKEKNKKLQKS